MASTFSFDIVSTYDKGEMINVYDQVQREIDTRYDLKGTQAALEWLDSSKSGFKIIGDNQFHLDALLEMVRKKAAGRGISQKTFTTPKGPEATLAKITWDVLFANGLDHEKAKIITALIRDKLPKVKSQIQGDEIRVSSPKKDELQSAMEIIRNSDLSFPVSFTNYR